MSRVIAVALLALSLASCGSNDQEKAALAARESAVTKAEAVVTDREAAVADAEARLKRAEANGLKVSDQAKLDAETARLKSERDAVASQRRIDKARTHELDKREAELDRREHPPTIDGNGLYKVGDDIDPGEYKMTTTSQCYYAILRSSDTSDIIDNNNVTGPARVTLSAGQYFETSRCGTWTLVL